MNKTSERWDVKANDNDINLTNNDTDYVPDYTMTIECRKISNHFKCDINIEIINFIITLLILFILAL